MIQQVFVVFLLTELCFSQITKPLLAFDFHAQIPYKYAIINFNTNINYKPISDYLNFYVCKTQYTLNKTEKPQNPNQKVLPGMRKKENKNREISLLTDRERSRIKR